MKFFKRHKKLSIFLIVLLILVLGIIFLVKQSEKAANKMLQTMNQSELGEADYRTIRSVVATTGTIESVNVASVSPEVNGVKVLEVKVKEGDAVKKGDVICVLDDTGLLEYLKNAKSSLTATTTGNNISLSSANRQLENLLAEKERSAQRFQVQIADAKESLDKAQKQADTLLQTYKDAKSKREDLTNKKNQNNANITAYDQKVQELFVAIMNWSGDPQSEELLAMQESFQQHQAALEGFQQQAIGLGEACTAASTAEQAAGDAYNQYVDSSLKAARSTYEQIVQNSEDTARNYENSILSAKDSLTSTNLNTENSLFNVNQQVEQYEKQIAACTVVAPFDGTVTGIHVKEGDLYAGAPIATIEDLSAYQVCAYIDEYEIGRVKVGQNVAIKTNGTGEEQLQGTVTYVASHAAQGMGSVSYKVLVSLDTPSDKIRLDMTAKLSIIETEAVDTLTVPFDSVGTEEDGSKYVEVATGGKDETGKDITRKVKVETGLESNYYIQITSGDLKQGDQVLIPKSDSGMSDLMEMLYGEGGMYGF